MLASSVKLGADTSVAAGPVGAGATAETANVSADILSFARAKGLYAGASLEGAGARAGPAHATASAATIARFIAGAYDARGGTARRSA